MELKRRTGPDGRVTHVDVVHTGINATQSWGAKHVAAWVDEGWMQIQSNRITITTGDGQPDLTYTINRRPGYYCADTGERIPLSDLALSQFMTQTQATLAPREAVAWLTSRGRSGKYVATRSYECVLDTALHEQFKKEA